MSGLRERFGRPLRLAIVGGGPDAWIGRMHRGAAEMDGWWRCTAGVFSTDPARSRAAGAALGFAPERSYGTVEEMLARERERDDPIDAVAIMTPNDTHYPVLCRRARRRLRRGVRQAGHARLRAGGGPRGAHPGRRAPVRGRPRL